MKLVSNIAIQYGERLHAHEHEIRHNENMELLD